MCKDCERLREALEREAKSHETLASELEAYPEQFMQSYYHGFAAKCIRAALAPSAPEPRESAEPADGSISESGALIWMTERLMGSLVAETMRGWLAGYRSTGRMDVRDADGTVKESLTVAEERGPEVGDVVYIHWPNDHHEVTTYSALLQAEIRGAAVVVLMRRAEVEARIGGKA